MKVKIIGAGSIGNHLAQASRRMGWDVAVADSDPGALERMKNEIYPKRYGAWDPAIQLFPAGKEPKAGFDIIIIGTPPDTHMKLAAAAIKEKPRLLHIEKPLCAPDLKGVKEFQRLMRHRPKTMVTVGYDHAVSAGIEAVRDMARKDIIGKVITFDVEFREHWKGIFSAHPWLAGPWDTYLGYWKRGGGAGGEHSHALHLWLFFSRMLGWGGAREVKALFDFKKERGAEYDRIAEFLIRAQKGGVGRVVQDVVTYPVRKRAFLQGEKGFIEWHCGGAPEGDVVRYQIEGQDAVEKIFSKKRPDDFWRETLHYDALLKGKIKIKDSPLAFERGLEVMEILNRAHGRNTR